jgi:DNA polymerase III psi subunit
MEKTSHLVLSNYQRAVLKEMGISSWQLSGEKKIHAKVDNQTTQAVTASSEVISREDALAKLKQTQTTEATDSVLLTFLPSDINFQILTDVLIALGLEAKPQKHISIAQLSHYSGYSLSWTQGEKVSFNHKHLMTPTLSELHRCDNKKLLWQQLQSALPLHKTN